MPSAWYHYHTIRCIFIRNCKPVRDSIFSIVTGRHHHRLCHRHRRRRCRHRHRLRHIATAAASNASAAFVMQVSPFFMRVPPIMLLMIHRFPPICVCILSFHYHSVLAHCHLSCTLCRTTLSWYLTFHTHFYCNLFHKRVQNECVLCVCNHVTRSIIHTLCGALRSTRCLLFCIEFN